MRYFVVSDDGNRYGPADIPTLNSWIQEGRLLPGTLLEEDGSGTRLAASAVSGLNFPNAGAAAPRPAAAPGQATSPGPSTTSGPQGSPYSSPSSGQAAPGNPYSASYAQNYSAGNPDAGKTELIFAWILAAIGGTVCCCFGGFIPAGIGAFLANKAKNDGNDKAQPALIVNGIIAVLSLLVTIGYVVKTVNAVNDPKFKSTFQQAMEQSRQQQLRRQGGQFTPPPNNP